MRNIFVPLLCGMIVLLVLLVANYSYNNREAEYQACLARTEVTPEDCYSLTITQTMDIYEYETSQLCRDLPGRCEAFLYRTDHLRLEAQAKGEKRCVFRTRAECAQ
jgi:hypothetical protein